MKSDFIEFIGNARQRKNVKFRNQLSIFIVCLILSLFIWVLVRLSKDYYYALEYHLSYTNIPVNYKLIGYSDSTLTVKVKVQGFDFITERFIVPHERKYEISLRNIRLRNSETNARGYLLTNHIGKDIVAQSSFTSDVFFVIPDTLFFEFEKLTISPISRQTNLPLLILPDKGKDSLLRNPDSVKNKSNPVRTQQNKP
ncbi:MAG: hypothetical protein M0P58_00445 [Bacteroidales bacterium]|nr:hypothetical protein [Bacteroidales bacterium]